MTMINYTKVVNISSHDDFGIQAVVEHGCYGRRDTISTGRAIARTKWMRRRLAEAGYNADGLILSGAMTIGSQTQFSFRKEVDEPRVICEGCKQEIDPEICWCGDYAKDHGHFDNHSAVPMGCTCHRAQE